MNKIYGVALFSAIVLSGCGDNTATEVTKDIATPASVEVKSKVAKPDVALIKKDEPKKDRIKKDTIEKSLVQKDIAKKDASQKQPHVSARKFYTIFKDSAKIATDGKEMLLLFGQNSDPYTQKIKDDIVSDDELSGKILKTVTPIYIDARGKKRHKFQYDGEMMDVDTKTLIGIYNVTSTPTLIFTDKKASHIFVVPGYMPPKQFKVTLDFVKQGLWKGKDRNNGDVYATLKKFYKENGIDTKADKK